jgi:plasmid stabilization system protein ParE
MSSISSREILPITPPQSFDQSKKQADSLRRFAKRGRVVPEIDDPAIRELLVNNYRLIYRIEPQRIAILAFLHGARDLKGLWGKRTK